MNVEEPIRLKPISFSRAHDRTVNRKFHDNKFQQMILLKSLAVTSDPNELKKMIGVRSVSEVYRTLDKLVLRKEYHQKLLELGIDFDFILSNYKEIIVTGKDKDRLVALGALLKSLGMHEYKETTAASASSWEDTLLKSIEDGKGSSQKVLTSGEAVEEEDYEVTIPEMPVFNPTAPTEEVKTLQDLYESKSIGL